MCELIGEPGFPGANSHPLIIMQPNDDNNSTSDSFESTETSLIKSFQSLLINTSGNMKTLEAFSSMIEEEIERVSNSGSDAEKTDSDTDNKEELEKSVPQETEESNGDNTGSTNQLVLRRHRIPSNCANSLYK